MSKKIKQGLAKIADDQARDWPGMRKLQSMNMPEVEELKAFLDYKYVDFDIRQDCAIGENNADAFLHFQGAKAALQLVRISLFGELMSDERHILLLDTIKEAGAQQQKTTRATRGKL